MCGHSGKSKIPRACGANHHRESRTGNLAAIHEERWPSTDAPVMALAGIGSASFTAHCSIGGSMEHSWLPHAQQASAANGSNGTPRDAL